MQPREIGRTAPRAPPAEKNTLNLRPRSLDYFRSFVPAGTCHSFMRHASKRVIVRVFAAS